MLILSFLRNLSLKLLVALITKNFTFYLQRTHRGQIDEQQLGESLEG